MIGATYTTVYRVTNGSWPSSVTEPLSFLVVSIIATGALSYWLVVEKRKQRGVPWGIVLLLAYAVLATVGEAACLWSAQQNNHQLLTEFKSGQARITEGFVELLRKEPAAGTDSGAHQPGDLIQVGERQFVFSYFDDRAGYNATKAHGGVLTNGAHVRIHDIRGRIVQIDLDQTLQTKGSRQTTIPQTLEGKQHVVTTPLVKSGQTYTTVFRMTDAMWPPAGIMIPAVIMIVSLIWIGTQAYRLFIEVRNRKRDKVIERVAFMVIFALVIAIAGSLLPNTYSEYDQLLTAYQRGEAHTTEGVVQVLRSQPWDGHAPGDLIQIGKEQFEVDYFSGAAGYNTTIAHGGVLTNGKHVRIHDVDGQIVQIDVLQTPQPSAQDQTP